MSKKRIIYIGAHPDDADIMFGGTATKLCKAGHIVKFLSVTNGDTGHHSLSRAETAKRRKEEARCSAKVCGLLEYEVMDNNCGLEPSVANREKVLRVIRKFAPDLVVTHRLSDYHPDHRATAQLVLDTAYIVTVPHYCEDTPIPEKTPVYAYSYDHFKDPRPFRADAAVEIDSVIEEKMNMFRCHSSQFFGWLAWNQGLKDFDVSKLSTEEEHQHLLRWFERFETAADLARPILVETYGAEQGAKVKYAETFEFSEYGHHCSMEEFRKLFQP